jgi:uncharacterized protein YggU (UPF0235/DUF167 family)
LVKVIFNSSEEIFVNQLTNEIDISIKKLPINGRSDITIINAISTYFDIKPEKIKIVHGLSSKTKFVEIS